MEKNNGSQQIIIDQNFNSQDELILSEEDLNKLAAVFSILINVDQRLKRKALREKEQPNESNYRT